MRTIGYCDTDADEVPARFCTKVLKCSICPRNIFIDVGEEECTNRVVRLKVGHEIVQTLHHHISVQHSVSCHESE